LIISATKQISLYNIMEKELRKRNKLQFQILVAEI
jgi:hypothetical protein